MKKIILTLLAVVMALAGCRNADAVRPFDQGKKGGEQMTEGQSVNFDVATFAGGCFWCTESDFEKIPGVSRVVSGYTGGRTENPTYEEVCSGDTGHYEAVQVYFDPAKVSYASLVEFFWKHVDPTDAGGQFVDRGSQYRTAIFARNKEQQRIAEESRDALNRSGKLKKPVATQILPLKVFYEAEDYHQDYSKTCSLQYAAYRVGSGRDRALEGIWGKAPEKTAAGDDFRKPDAASLRKILTPLQYQVTQEEGTEPPFRNTYWDNKEEGIYVDVVSGEPLFSSRDKYDSGTGWPSFTKPLEAGNIVTREDRRLFATRTEVRSRRADSHLGHVFPDGPKPTGLRYCMNSAALRFIPEKDLEKEGYGVYRKLFGNAR